jgi:hypothetical protein
MGASKPPKTANDLKLCFSAYLSLFLNSWINTFNYNSLTLLTNIGVCNDSESKQNNYSL